MGRAEIALFLKKEVDLVLSTQYSHNTKKTSKISQQTSAFQYLSLLLHRISIFVHFKKTKISKKNYKKPTGRDLKIVLKSRHYYFGHSICLKNK